MFAWLLTIISPRLSPAKAILDRKNGGRTSLPSLALSCVGWSEGGAVQLE